MKDVFNDSKELTNFLKGELETTNRWTLITSAMNTSGNNSGLLTSFQTWDCVSGFVIFCGNILKHKEWAMETPKFIGITNESFIRAIQIVELSLNMKLII